jgi:hypothetical protein
LTVTTGVLETRLARTLRGGRYAPGRPGGVEAPTRRVAVRLNGAAAGARRQYHANSVLPIVRSGKWPDPLPVAGHRAPGTELAGTAPQSRRRIPLQRAT